MRLSSGLALAFSLMLSNISLAKEPPTQPLITQALTGTHQNGQKAFEGTFRELSGQLVKHGPFVHYNANGAKESEGVYANDKQQGLWVHYKPNNIRFEGHYQEGLKVGPWYAYQNDQLIVEENYFADKLQGIRTSYYPEGQKQSEQCFLAGQLNGKESQWDKNGQLLQESHWKEGLLHGSYHVWTSNGVEKIQGTYCSGIPEGLWAWKDEKGSLIAESDFTNPGALFYLYLPNDEGSFYLDAEVPFSSSKEHGLAKYYRKDGSLLRTANYEMGKKHGEARSYHEDGSLKQILFFDKGETTGVAKEFYPGEKELIAKEMEFLNGPQEVHIKEYYQTGTLKSEYSLSNQKKEGPSTEFYPSGQTKRLRSFVAGKKEGEWQEFALSGALTKKAFYVADKFEGSYEEWHPNKEKPLLKMRGIFANDLKVDRWTEWYPEGNKKLEIDFEAGALHGTYRSYYPKKNQEEADILHLEGQFNAGVKEGSWTSYHNNGMVESRIQYAGGLKDGPYEEWYGHHIRGQALMKVHGYYHNGLQEGDWVHYFETGGTASKRHFRVGRLNGTFEEFYPNGTLKSTSSFVNGTQEGLLTLYYPNEKEYASTQFYKGMKHGPYKVYFENGNIALEGCYKLGIPEGHWTWYSTSGKAPIAEEDFHEGTGNIFSFYPSGERKSLTPLVKGFKHGLETVWYENGITQKEESYDYDLPHGVFKSYSDEGVLISEMHWDHGLRDGDTRLWFGNKQERFKLSYQKEIPTGESCEWYDNGALKTKGLWTQGAREGLWEAHDRYGTPLLEEHYQAGALQSLVDYSATEVASK